MEIWVIILIVLIILAILAAICSIHYVGGGAYDTPTNESNASAAYQMLINKFPSLTAKYTEGDLAVDVTIGDGPKKMKFDIFGMNPSQLQPYNFEIQYPDHPDRDSNFYENLSELELDIRKMINTPIVEPKSRPRVMGKLIENNIENFNNAISMIKSHFPTLLISAGTPRSATIYTPNYTNNFSIFGLDPVPSNSMSPKFQLEYPNLDTFNFYTLDELHTAIQTFLNTLNTTANLQSTSNTVPNVNIPKANAPTNKLLNNMRTISKKIQYGMCNIL